MEKCPFLSYNDQGARNIRASGCPERAAMSFSEEDFLIVELWQGLTKDERKEFFAIFEPFLGTQSLPSSDPDQLS